MDPTIFPNPDSFDPERWIQAAARGERLDRFLVNFTKGSRSCLGIKYFFPPFFIEVLANVCSLAYAELYLTVAHVFRRFELELFETDVDDVRLVRDRFFAAPRYGSKGVRAVVRGELST